MKALFVAISIVIITHSLSNFVWAEWEDSQTVIEGTWGTDLGQFGYKRADPTDGFPKKFEVDVDQNIIVADSVNLRFQVFMASGKITAFTFKDINVKWPIRKWPTDYWGIYKNGIVEGGVLGYQFYDFSGKLLNEFVVPKCRLIKVNTDGSILIFEFSNNGRYQLYSQTGKILKTYSEPPLELGRVKNNSLSNGNYEVIVEYPDTTYKFVSDQPLDKYYRDQDKFLYRVDTYTQETPVVEVTAYKVSKYNTSGREVGELNMPISEFEPMPPEFADYPTWNHVPVVEYGEPTVAQNGDIYCWARTKTEYKILKWTWKEITEPVTSADGGNIGGATRKVPRRHR